MQSPQTTTIQQATFGRLRLHRVADENQIGEILGLAKTGGGAEGRRSRHQLTPTNSIAALLHDLGCLVVIEQDPALDKDYQSEFKAFYSTTFLDYSRYSRRLHFFSLCAEEGQSALDYLDTIPLDDATQTPHYLGFVNLRPLASAPIGRSVLAAPSELAFLTVKDSFRSTLAGRTLRILGAPFMQQDSAVGTCAHVALWTALRVRRKRDGRDAKTISDISIASGDSVLFGPVLPSKGLGINTMLSILERFGYHGHPISTAEPPPERLLDAGPLQGYAQHGDRVRDRIYPYIESGLPVIAFFGTEKSDFSHAVVVVGHDWDADRSATNLPTRTVALGDRPNERFSFYSSAGWIDSLFIQNDNHGPYQRSGNDDGPYSLEKIQSIIPLLPKDIYVDAEGALLAVDDMLRRLYAIAFAASDVTRISGTSDFDKEFVLRPMLTSRHEFRKWAIDNASGELKNFYRERHLPETLWMFEIIHVDGFHQAGSDKPNPKHAATRRVGEILIDPTGDIYDLPVLCAHMRFDWKSQAKRGVLIDINNTDKSFSVFAIDEPPHNYKLQILEK